MIPTIINKIVIFLLSFESSKFFRLNFFPSNKFSPPVLNYNSNRLLVAQFDLSNLLH